MRLGLPQLRSELRVGCKLNRAYTKREIDKEIRNCVKPYGNHYYVIYLHSALHPNMCVHAADVKQIGIRISESIVNHTIMSVDSSPVGGLKTTSPAHNNWVWQSPFTKEEKKIVARLRNAQHLMIRRRDKKRDVNKQSLSHFQRARSLRESLGELLQKTNISIRKSVERLWTRHTASDRMKVKSAAGSLYNVHRTNKKKQEKFVSQS